MADAQGTQKHADELRHPGLVKHAAVAHQRVEQHQRHQAVVGVGDGAGQRPQHQWLQLPGGDGSVAHVLPQLDDAVCQMVIDILLSIPHRAA